MLLRFREIMIFIQSGFSGRVPEACG